MVTVRAGAGVVSRVGVSAVCERGEPSSSTKTSATRFGVKSHGMLRLTRSRTDTSADAGAGNAGASGGTSMGTVSVRTVRAVGVRVCGG